MAFRLHLKHFLKLFFVGKIVGKEFEKCTEHTPITNSKVVAKFFSFQNGPKRRFSLVRSHLHNFFLKNCTLWALSFLTWFQKVFEICKYTKMTITILSTPKFEQRLATQNVFHFFRVGSYILTYLKIKRMPEQHFLTLFQLSISNSIIAKSSHALHECFLRSVIFFECVKDTARHPMKIQRSSFGGWTIFPIVSCSLTIRIYIFWYLWVQILNLRNYAWNIFEYTPKAWALLTIQLFNWSKKASHKILIYRCSSQTLEHWRSLFSSFKLHLSDIDLSPRPKRKHVMTHDAWLVTAKGLLLSFWENVLRKNKASKQCQRQEEESSIPNRWWWWDNVFGT